MELIVSSFSSSYLQSWVETSGSEHERERGRGEGPACRAQHVSRDFWTSSVLLFYFPESGLPRQLYIYTSCWLVALLGMAFDCGLWLFCRWAHMKSCINSHSEPCPPVYLRVTLSKSTMVISHLMSGSTECGFSLELLWSASFMELKNLKQFNKDYYPPGDRAALKASWQWRF